MNSSSKGLELPISVIVIISLAVLVLLAISLFFIENVGKGSEDISGQSSLFQQCQEFRSAYTCDKAKMPASLKAVCDSEGWTEDGCLVACGCLSADQLPAGTQLRKQPASGPGTPQAVESEPGSSVFGVDIL